MSKEELYEKIRSFTKGDIGWNDCKTAIDNCIAEEKREWTKRLQTCGSIEFCPTCGNQFKPFVSIKILAHNCFTSITPPIVVAYCSQKCIKEARVKNGEKTGLPLIEKAASSGTALESLSLGKLMNNLAADGVNINKIN